MRAKLTKKAEDYIWSSTRFNLGLIKNDPLIDKKNKELGSPTEWSKWLDTEPSEIGILRHHFRVGRPLGTETFVR